MLAEQKPTAAGRHALYTRLASPPATEPVIELAIEALVLAPPVLCVQLGLLEAVEYVLAGLPARQPPHSALQPQR